jgi:hypothetical protein
LSRRYSSSSHPLNQGEPCPAPAPSPTRLRRAVEGFKENQANRISGWQQGHEHFLTVTNEQF